MGTTEFGTLSAPLMSDWPYLQAELVADAPYLVDGGERGAD